jgi:hypothetical protein
MSHEICPHAFPVFFDQGTLSEKTGAGFEMMTEFVAQGIPDLLSDSVVGHIPHGGHKGAVVEDDLFSARWSLTPMWAY